MNKQKIEVYNKKYLYELKCALRTIMPKLTEAFINVFGPKYKDYLEYTLNHMNYTYFICENYIKLYLKIKRHISHSDKKVLRYYRQYLNYLDNLYAYTEDNIDEFLVKHYLIDTDLDSDWLTDESFLDTFNCDAPLFQDLMFMETEFSDYQIIKHIFLPIFSLNIYTIAHELTHAIPMRHYFLVDEDVEYPKLFKPQEDEEDTISEELMVDYISRMVIREFLRIGGVIPPCLNRFKYYSQYQCNDFLVEPFFQNFDELLLEAYISGNYNLIKIIGVSNFDAYCEYITYLYNKEEITEEDIKKLEDMINSMTDNYEKNIVTR